MTLLEDDAAIRGILESVAAPDADEPERQASRGEVVRLIQAALDALPNRYGDVLEWKYVDGLSVKQIAAAARRRTQGGRIAAHAGARRVPRNDAGYRRVDRSHERGAADGVHGMTESTTTTKRAGHSRATTLSRN